VRKSLYIILILFIFSGCGSLQQGWQNFKAYYNTFHNAKDFYRQGLEKNLAQLPDLNANKPVRVFRQPTQAGLEDFQSAIEKGESILRDHNQSKYVVPSLFIIGKSHYYRSEFFAALEQFQNIANATNGVQRQEAILWQGITYYDLGNYSEGIEVMLYGMESDLAWQPQLLAKVRIATAQLHAAQENWVNASSYLEMSLPDLEEEELKARAYFLLGQMYEKREMINEALFAYGQIADIRTSFDMEFNAMRKEAEMLRATGNYGQSASLYRSMLRDDKYIDYGSELRYEIAKTLHESGQIGEALEAYRAVLDHPLQTPDAVTSAMTYYNLGEIYRDEKDNFMMASAYFDSAAAENANPEALPEGFMASELSESFGEYVTVKRQIIEKDSLLNLAEMDEDERREFLAEIRRERIREAEQELEELQEQRSQMLVAEPEAELADAVGDSEDGFLNINNSARLADASLRFQAIWGDRPLADNWRRREAVSGSRFDNPQQQSIEGVVGATTENGMSGANAVIDLSDVPFTPEAKQQVRNEIEQLNYQLANIFFLSLEMPDSAANYYQKVIRSSADSVLAAKSIYSLAEIELEKQNREEAIGWYRKLRQVEAGNEFSRRLANQLGLKTEERMATERAGDALPDSLRQSEANPADRAERLKMAARYSDDENRTSLLLYDASQAYLEAARSQTDPVSIRRWLTEQDSIKSMNVQWQALKDSSQVMLNDTTLTEEQQGYWQSIADSTYSEPDPSQDFPFYGAYWDSTRVLLAELTEEHPGSYYSDEARTLFNTLKIPEPESKADTSSAETVQQDEQFPLCEELDVRPRVDGGLTEFMNTLSYPSWTANVTLRGELEYLLTITAGGSPEEMQQMSNMDRSGIPEAVEEGVRESLMFENPTGEVVRCRVVFPINL
jgi:tetratricopeptide (TPR) repeat protein